MLLEPDDCGPILLVGRVRMPHNNRMSGSSALNTSAIWKDVIKYDPYAGNEGETATLTFQ